ncbi:MAG: TolC family protein [Firmicutes bacterium]|nr:TolC family protein [Bacillota bacterium]MCM1401975.1 TolC family protein [Bacteroides sp.]MCM1477904.1 TolC family protein [Bacteroides sp.]
MAESQNLQMKPLFTAQREATEEISEARNNKLPEINSTLTLSYIGSGFTTKRNLSDYQKAPIPHFGSGLGVSVSQPVWSGGAITAGIEMAEMKLTAARLATEMKRDDIRFYIAGFYLDLYKCINLRKVIVGNIEQAQKVLDEMHARYEQGVALRNDITRYELLVSNLELDLVKVDNTAKILRSELCRSVGLPLDTELMPDTTILAQALPTGSEQTWREEAVNYSPALQLAKTRVEMSRTAEKIVEADRLPKIGLQAGWTMDGPILVEIPPINRNLSYWFVGVGVKYNLSSLYKNNKSRARSRATTIKAVEEYEAMRENVELDVRSAHIRYLEAFEELKSRQKGVELAERNYGITFTRYGGDMALITDMLDAANSKLEAEQRLVDARINIIYHYYKLLFTSGKI